MEAGPKSFGSGQEIPGVNPLRGLACSPLGWSGRHGLGFLSAGLLVED